MGWWWPYSATFHQLHAHFSLLGVFPPAGDLIHPAYGILSNPVLVPMEVVWWCFEPLEGMVGLTTNQAHVAGSQNILAGEMVVDRIEELILTGIDCGGGRVAKYFVQTCT